MKTKNRRPGALRELLNFQQRSVSDDGFGNEVSGPFLTQFTAYAGLAPRTGGESVTAARLGGKQPYVMTVRYAANVAGVTPAWRVQDARNPLRVFAIVSPLADPDGQNAWLECLVVDGEVS